MITIDSDSSSSSGSDDSDSSSDAGSSDDPACVLCKMSQDDMILCDECGLAYHPYCLTPRLLAMPSAHDSFFGPCCMPRQILGTCWVPMADIPLNGAGLAVLPGSHNSLPHYERTLKNADVPYSYFSKGRGMTWHCGAAAMSKDKDKEVLSFRAGDVVFLDSKVVHCTAKNSTDLCTMTLDFRWAIAPTGRTNYGNTVQTYNLRKATTELHPRDDNGSSHGANGSAGSSLAK